MADVRLIDAIAYYKELKEEMDYPGRSEEFMIAIDVAIADLADAPTVDAVPVVHGRWIEDDETARRYCSSCGFSIRDDASYELYGDYQVKPKHCPECGAKMDLEVPDGKT